MMANTSEMTRVQKRRADRDDRSLEKTETMTPQHHAVHSDQISRQSVNLLVFEKCTFVMYMYSTFGLNV